MLPMEDPVLAQLGRSAGPASLLAGGCCRALDVSAAAQLEPPFVAELRHLG